MHSSEGDPEFAGRLQIVDGALHALPRLRILLIDDSPEDREFIERALRAGGWSGEAVVEAESADEGLQMLEDGRFDCALLDYNMPGRDGLKVLEEFRLCAPHVAVIVITGQGSEQVASEAIQAGAAGYLIKSNLTADLLQTAIVRAHGAKQAERERKEAIETMKRRFLRHMSHDLRTPLNAIIGLSEAAMAIGAERMKPERIDDYFVSVRQAGHDILRVIDSINLLLSLDDGNHDLEISEFNAVDVIRAAIVDAEAAFPAERPVVYDGPDLETVAGEPEALRQCLDRLLSNARKYGGPLARIVVRVCTRGDRLRIEVLDDGPGIPEDLIRQIGDPFLRGADPLVENSEGAGLGLAICQAYARLQGGRLEVRLRASGGTAASLVLRRWMSGNAANDPSASPSEATGRPRFG